MGVHFEAQDTSEVIQVRSRELQAENTEKLEQIIPVVQTIEDVDLPNMESDTKNIKEMIINNIDNQVDLDTLADALDKANKGIIELKKSVTRLNKTMKEINQKIEDFDKLINGDTNG